MQYFIANGGSCNYDVESIGDIEFPLRYRHLLQQWAGAILHGWHKGQLWHGN